VPGAHSEHDALPVLAHAPAGQVAHVATESALVALLAVPAGHGKHEEWSGEAYSPTVQDAHDVEAGDETEPGAHAEHSLAPAEAPVKEPAGHVSQDDMPVAALDVPSGQPTHEAASALANRPAVHAVHSLACVAEIEPGAHATQDASEDAPAAALNLPVEHATQDDAGGSAKVPARHCTHAVEAEAETKPALQGVHADEPLWTPVEEPAGHVVHCVRPCVAA
jgi:hypothetical protein